MKNRLARIYKLSERRCHFWYPRHSTAFDVADSGEAGPSFGHVVSIETSECILSAMQTGSNAPFSPLIISVKASHGVKLNNVPTWVGRARVTSILGGI